MGGRFGLGMGGRIRSESAVGERPRASGNGIRAREDDLRAGPSFRSDLKKYPQRVPGGLFSPFPAGWRLPWPGNSLDPWDIACFSRDIVYLCRETGCFPEK